MGAAKRFYGNAKQAPDCMQVGFGVPPPGCTPSAAPGWVKGPDGKSYYPILDAQSVAPKSKVAAPPRGMSKQLSLFD